MVDSLQNQKVGEGESIMKKVLSAVLAATMAVSMAACGQAGDSGQQATGTAIRIGGIGPLTGGAAIYGNAVKNGAQLAVEEINAKGGLQLELKFEDDENDVEKSLNAYNNLKDWGMQVLLGTVTTQPCLQIAPQAAEDNMFLLTPSASAPEVVASATAFQVCFTDPNQGQASADYIKENGLASKVAIIYDSSDPYSAGVHDKFKQQASVNGLEVVADEAFTADSKTDFFV